MRATLGGWWQYGAGTASAGWDALIDGGATHPNLNLWGIE